MRRTVLLVAVLASLSLPMVVSLSPASACTLAPVQPTEDELVARSTVVFEGVALNSRDPNAGAMITSSGDPVFWTFSVTRTVKGSVGPQVEVGTPRSGASCGFAFTPGTAYRVYATGTGTGTGTTLSTTLGSGTRELAQVPATTTTAPRGTTTPTTRPGTAPPAVPRPGTVTFTG